jgi:ABC-type dipeptide/oligopeptide/nickel transport system ATPase component
MRIYLLYCIDKIYDVFSLLEKNVVVGKPIIGPRHLTFPIYSSIPDVKNIAKYQEELAVALGVKPAKVSLTLGNGCYELMIPSPHRQLVTLTGVTERVRSFRPRALDNPLNIILGVSPKGEVVMQKLGTNVAPHLGIFGTSGSGKSEFLRCIITQIAERTDGSTRLVIYSPKIMDFADFEGTKPLLYPITDDPDIITHMLSELEVEMELRSKRVMKGERVVVVLDEFTNLLAKKKRATFYVERLIERGRSEGIILVLATQTGSKDVFGGSPVIRQNLTFRVIFQVWNARESALVSGHPKLDCHLLEGEGDAVVVLGPRNQRVQTPLVNPSRIKALPRTAESMEKPRLILLSGDIFSPLEKLREEREPDEMRGLKERKKIKAENIPVEVWFYLRDRGEASREKLVKDLGFGSRTAANIMESLNKLKVILPKRYKTDTNKVNERRLNEVFYLLGLNEAKKSLQS